MFELGQQLYQYIQDTIGYGTFVLAVMVIATAILFREELFK